LAIIVLLSIVNGATQAVLRSMIAQAVPRGQAAEFFGFNAFVGTISAAIGPILYGALATITGSERIALASFGVDPVSWTPEHLGSRSSQWQGHDHHIRRSFGTK
jgi:MFS-type transporter involved in bile tolerance (Atg22 family)